MVSDDIEAVVEDTELPRRLKDEVYSAVEERGVGVEDADRIAQAVESRYMQTRVRSTPTTARRPTRSSGR